MEKYNEELKAKKDMCNVLNIEKTMLQRENNKFKQDIE